MKPKNTLILRKRIVWISLIWFTAVSLTSIIYANGNWSQYTKVWRIAALWYSHLFILVPGVYWVTKKVSFENTHHLLFFFIHLLAAVIYGILNTTFAFLDLHIYSVKSISDYLHRMYPQYFNISLIGYAAIAGWFYIIQYMKKSREIAVREANLKKLASEAELKALKAQINPHFLFNTLHAINALISQSAEKAREVVTRLSDIFRYALEASKKELVPMEEEIQFTRDYLEIEKIRLGDRLQFDINVNGETGSLHVPPIILQPLVENAIVHGIAPKKDGGIVNISVSLSGDSIEFKVYDTGLGIDPETGKTIVSKGTGLQNTFERLRILYPETFEYSISPNTPSGCIVSFRFRYQDVQQ